MIKNHGNIGALLALLLFAVLPLVLSIGYALLYSFGLTGVLNTGFTTLHYQKLFSDKQSIYSFLYSAGIALATVSIAVIIAMRLALRHYAYFRKGILSYLVYLPLAFPAMVSAFFFFQFLSKAGILSRIFYQLNITSSISAFPDLINDKWGIGIMIAHLFICCPFFILLFVSRIETENINGYLTLASSLGCSKKQASMRIAIPILLQKTFANIALYFIFIFGSYEIPILLGRSNPEMVSVMAVRKLQKFNLLDIPQGYAIAVIYTILVLIILVMLLRKRKLAYDF